MKKFLALVLALVMTMSLVTISAGAKDFADADKVTYTEAVDVMTALKVVDGDTAGNFNPTNGLTRGAAAKIICNMILGPTTAGALVANEAPFADVAVDNVFAGYIAYCVNEGIISGYADGTFKPSAPLTGYAFMKMLLGALGYDAEIEGYTGSNWSIQVAKRALNIGLNKGLKDDFNGSKALTREEAMLYAFNALKATMVDYQNNSKVTIGDVVITNSSKAEEVKVAVAEAGYSSTNTTENATVQFCEKYFSNLKHATVTDAYGRPASQWKIKAEKVGTYAETPVLTYTAEVKGTVLADDLDDAGVAAYDSTKANSTAIAFKVFINGEDCTAWGNFFGVDMVDIQDVKDVFDTKTNLPFTGKGVNVEIYADADGNLTRIAVVTPYLAEVTKVEKDVASTRSVDERALKVTLKNVIGVGDVANIVIDSDVTGFDAVYSEVEKGDFVLVTPNAGDVTAIDGVVDVVVPETVTGAISYVKANSKVTMGGVAYDATYVYDQTTYGGADFGLTSKEATLYLDANGYVIGYEGPSATGDKAVAVIDKYNTLEDGKIVSMLKGVTSDGAIVEWKYEGAVNPSLNTVYTHDADENDSSPAEAGNGKYVLSAISTSPSSSDVVDGATVYVGSTTVAATAKSMSVATVKAYFADDVKFIFVNDEKAVVKEGVQKVATAAPMYATIDVDNDGNEFITAVYVLAAAAASSATSEDVIFVVTESTPANVKVTVDGKDKTFKAYAAYVNGVKVDDFYTAATVSANAFWDKEVEDESQAYVASAHTSADALSTVVDGTVSDVVADIMTVSSVDYDLTGATIVDTRVNGDIDEGAELKAAAASIEVSFIYDEDTNVVSYLYVTAK